MSNFVKLYGSILYSTVWLEPLPTKVVWITMLALADADGIVRAAIPNLAQIAGVTRKDTETAIDTLSSPDPDSKSKEFDGRRIQAIEGGWLILNHRKYRDLRTDTQIATAERVRRHREKRKGEGVTVTDVTNATHRNGVKPSVRAEEEEDREEDKKQKKQKTKATEQPSPFPKDICDALYETWTARRGAIQYPAFRKAFTPLFPAKGARFTQKQLEDAIEVYTEWVEGLSPRDAGFETVYRFVGDITRWTRLGGMPAIDPSTRLPTERGQLA